MKSNIFRKYLVKDYNDCFGCKKGGLRRALKKKSLNEFNKDFNQPNDN